MEEIERIVRKYPERFTEEEKRHINAAVSGRSSGYEIRQCDVCGSYMNKGYCFNDGSHYCSGECMRNDGVSRILPASWDCPDDLIERLNQCRRELLADGVKLPDRKKVLEGFFSYWQEEVLPLYEEDGAILESFEDALNNDSPYSNGKDYISWNDAITEATK